MVRHTSRWSRYLVHSGNHHSRFQRDSPGGCLAPPVVLEMLQCQAVGVIVPCADIHIGSCTAHTMMRVSMRGGSGTAVSARLP